MGNKFSKLTKGKKYEQKDLQIEDDLKIALELQEEEYNKVVCPADQSSHQLAVRPVNKTNVNTNQDHIDTSSPGSAIVRSSSTVAVEGFSEEPSHVPRNLVPGSKNRKKRTSFSDRMSKLSSSPNVFVQKAAQEDRSKMLRPHNLNSTFPLINPAHAGHSSSSLTRSSSASEAPRGNVPDDHLAWPAVKGTLAETDYGSGAEDLEDNEKSVADEEAYEWADSDGLRTSSSSEANDLYEGFIRERKTMELAYRSAPKQQELLASAFEYSGVKIVVGVGNIEDEETDAIVNSTSSNFDMKGAISQAIGIRAGTEWVEDCKRIGNLDDVYVTDAPKLDCKKVIHVRVPQDIEDCRRLAIKVLLVATSYNLESISFPMIGTGGGQLRPTDIAPVLAEVVTLAAHNNELRSIKIVRFVANEDYKYDLFLMTVKQAIYMASSLQPVEQPEYELLSSAYDAIKLPKSWVPLREHELCREIELNASDPEFVKMQVLFNKEKVKAVDTAKYIQKCALVKVIRVQNPALYRHYKIEKEKLIRIKYYNKPKVLQKLSRTLFHGTTESTVWKINSVGFDHRYSGKNAIAFGKGVYFARDLSYSCDPQYSTPNSKGIKIVYVAKALVGVSTQGGEGMDHLPTDSHGVLFDSAVNDPNDPTIFVIFHGTQIYPKYILHIAKRS